jgi:predicted oxidoreductase
MGRALGNRREQVPVATKFGLTFEECTGIMTGRDASPSYIKRARDASLRRLNTNYIDPGLRYPRRLQNVRRAEALPGCSVWHDHVRRRPGQVGPL